jgi:glutaredoxin-like YruB-family protein
MPYTAPVAVVPNITIYSTPTCGYCKMAKEYLKSKNIAFTDVDVSIDQKRAEEMIAKSGQFGVPVIDVNGKLIIGFDKRKLDEYIAGLNAPKA